MKKAKHIKTKMIEKRFLKGSKKDLLKLNLFVSVLNLLNKSKYKKPSKLQSLII
jgi:hypothetical protein